MRYFFPLVFFYTSISPECKRQIVKFARNDSNIVNPQPSLTRSASVPTATAKACERFQIIRTRKFWYTRKA